MLCLILLLGAEFLGIDSFNRFIYRSLDRSFDKRSLVNNESIDITNLSNRLSKIQELNKFLFTLQKDKNDAQVVLSVLDVINNEISRGKDLLVTESSKLDFDRITCNLGCEIFFSNCNTYALVIILCLLVTF